MSLHRSRYDGVPRIVQRKNQSAADRGIAGRRAASPQWCSCNSECSRCYGIAMTPHRPLRVLITNLELFGRSGTTLYVRDLALELQRQGHEPIVYTLHLGAISQELRAANIPVVRWLWQIGRPPDIIHAHHCDPALDVLRYFPRTPAIYICHDHQSQWDRVPLHPQIRRYFGVSELCIERVVGAGVPRENVELIYNFVDTRRFKTREALAATPCRALVFSNYARIASYLPAVQEACRRAGLPLDVVGSNTGQGETHPEALLHRYDLVFAKGKAAMEAMASGAAVILCDFGGLGPMVTVSELPRLRPLNFGFQALVDPVTPESVLQRIGQYDAEEARRVNLLLRRDVGLDDAVRHLVSLYRQIVVSQGGEADVGAYGGPRPLIARTTLYKIWFLLGVGVRLRLKQLPGVAAALGAALARMRA